MSLTTRCRRCGRAYPLDRAALLSGQRRFCPACRNPPGTPASGAPDVVPKPYQTCTKIVPMPEAV